MDEHIDKKVKLDDTQEQDTRCEFVIAKKNRQCHMLKSKQSNNYCTEHLLLVKKREGAELRNTNTKKGQRVPCPLDPKHTVWQIDLNKHLKKCTKGKANNMNVDKAWFKKDFNCGDPASVSSNTEEKNIKDLIVKVVPVLESLQSGNQDFVEKSNIPFEILKDSHVEHHRVAQLFGSQSKHAIQQSSLIQHIKRAVDADSENKTLIAEFGCGRAELSRYLNLSLSLDTPEDSKVETEKSDSSQITTSSTESTEYDFLLIDRGTNRLKFDHKFVEESKRGKSMLVKREKCDIKDIDFNQLIKEDFSTHDDSPNGEYKKIVSISKHLCGVATDLTLKCLENSMDNIDRTHKLCIAMCCRHVCNYRDYVNQEYIKKLFDENVSEETKNNNELTPETFFLALTKICSWATCGRRPDVDVNNKDTHFTKLSILDREKLGLVARRIIDLGRLDYITNSAKWQVTTKISNSTPKLVQYCEMDISLENVALIL